MFFPGRPGLTNIRRRRATIPSAPLGCCEIHPTSRAGIRAVAMVLEGRVRTARGKARRAPAWRPMRSSIKWKAAPAWRGFPEWKRGFASRGHDDIMGEEC